MSDQSTHQRAWRLMAPFADDQLAADQRGELEAMLLGDADLLREFVLYMELHARVVWDARAKRDALESRTPENVSPEALPPAGSLAAGLARKAMHYLIRPTPLSMTVAALVVGLLIGTMALITVPLYRQLARPAGNEKTALFVATLTNAENAVWAAGATPRRTGDRLAAGQQLVLQNGLAQIVFDGGCIALLEGPATLQLLTQDSGELQRGKLTARVSGPEGNFTVETHMARVVDLGTQFGMHVDDTGVGVFVREGTVAVEPKSARGRQSEHVVLRAGNAWHSDRAPPEWLAGGQSFAWSLKVAPPQAFEDWRNFSDALRQREDLIAYYDFQRDPDDPSRLINRAPAGVALHGTIVGANWTRGRWTEKDALAFYEGASRVEVNLPGEHRTLTLAAWVYLDEVRPFNAFLMSDGWATKGQLHWQVDGAQAYLSVAIKDITVGVRAGRVPTGHWLQAAAVIDADAGLVTQYMNGRLIGHERVAAGVPLLLHASTIGNWQDQRRLQGRMDELIVLRSALDEFEIRKLYQSRLP